MIENVEKTIRDYLPEVIHLSLATCHDNMPWVCEVHYVFDADLNLYWRSRSTKRHSKEIEANPNVAGNIVKQHTADEEPRGVYFEGAAEMLYHVDANHPAYKLYCERFGTDKDILAEAETDHGHKFYKISVKKYYLFDNKDSHPSKKYELEWK